MQSSVTFQGYTIKKVQREETVVENTTLKVVNYRKGKRLYLLEINTAIEAFIKKMEEKFSTNKTYEPDCLFISNFSIYNNENEEIKAEDLDDGAFIVNAKIVVDKIISKNDCSWVKMECSQLRVLEKKYDTENCVV